MRILKISSVPKNRLNLLGSWCKILEMDTNELKKQTGFNDDQIDYLIKKIDVLKRGKAQGKAREYSFRDVALFQTITSLRESGVSIRDINKLLNVIKENPGKHATIAVYPVKNKKPMVKLELNVTKKEFDTQLEANPDLLLLLDGDWLSPDKADEAVFFVAGIWGNEDQLELDLTAEESVIMNEA